MKNLSGLITLILVMCGFTAIAQQAKINYFRPWDKNGINVFEPSKNETSEFQGVSVRVGGSFTQQYQMLKHENNADVKLAADGKTNLNQLYPLGSGFNLATANLNFDFQIEDGIRVCLENYMSSRHHSEFWVKGGYIQIDKLPMFNNPEWFTKYMRVRIGHFGINYGDQQFRRTDNGNAIFNPFVGNYILDAFTTEIGGEVYIFPVNDLMVMAGVTAGLINGDVRDYAPTDDGKNGKKPSTYFKVAYDKQISDDFRFRLSASTYMNKETPRNTIYGGDRTGSRFYFAMEPLNFLSSGVVTATTGANRFTSGRIDPGFGNEITAFQVNPFIKFKGLELFGVYERATGKRSSETGDRREIQQIGGELIFRFLPQEQLYIGGRYNKVTGRLSDVVGLDDGDINIDRVEIAAGYFPTKNLLLKVSNVVQNYKDFPKSDYRSEGKFNGFMIEAVIGF